MSRPFSDIVEKSQNPESSLHDNYVKMNFTSATLAGEKGTLQTGESCEVYQLRDVLAYLRGTVNLYTGWANDGKSVWLDYMGVLKAKKKGWKKCAYKPENISYEMIDGKMQLSANRIYNNLAWTYTGKTWDQNYYERNKSACSMMTFEEKNDAFEFITSHFFIIDFDDEGLCDLDKLIEQMWYMYNEYGIDWFDIDPWNTIRYPSHGRDDHDLVNAFVKLKRFAMKTNTIVNIVNHPKSMHNVRIGKKHDSPFKIVTQFDQIGGAAWDMKMDGIYSVYNPERHLLPPGHTIQFHNLKQKEREAIGCSPGSYDFIIFDRHRRQYWFDGYNPLTEETKRARAEQERATYQAAQPIINGDDLPF